jgi:hypothetical protein
MTVQLPPKPIVYAAPEIIDYGSISDHTFTRSLPAAACGAKDPPKDMQPCRLDKFCEWTCLS